MKLAQGVSCFPFGHKNRPYFLLFIEFNIPLNLFFVIVVVVVIVSMLFKITIDWKLRLICSYRAIFNF